MRRALTVAVVCAAACTGQIGEKGDLPPGATRPGELTAVEPLARRLTREEYGHTIADVVGLTLDADALGVLPADRPIEGFANIASGQTVLPDHVRGYASLARTVVASPEFAAFRERLVDCADTSAECARATTEALGGRLFRRPIDERERALYGGLFDTVVDEYADDPIAHEAAANAVAEAMLQSPGFLYLLEDELDGEGTRELSGHELATRLSYALWASAPDEALLEAAANGALDDPEGLAAEVERMLADPRVDRVRERFVRDWARLESLPDDDGLKGELIASAIAFYRDHLAEGGALFELFDARSAVLTPALAEGYGLEPVGDGLRTYDLTDVEGRAGLLAQPGIVAGMTNADGGEIVARGLFLQRQVFCGSPPDPPASLQDAIDEFVAEQPEDASERDIAETRLMRSECGACHSQFDPLAYGFERFDFRGRFRDSDDHGNELRVDGWIPATYDEGGVEVGYGDFDAYVALLADHPRVQRCFVQRHAEQALGATLERGQLSAAAELADRLGPSGGHEDLMRLLVLSELFRLRAIPEDD